MPHQLSVEQQDEIFRKLRDVFIDLAFFDQLLADKLRALIKDTNRIEIDIKTTRKLTERYYDVSIFSSDKDKAILTQIHLVLRTAYALILSYYPENQAEFMRSTDELKAQYPAFRDQDEEELKYLLHFRNYMKMALKIIPARLSKQILLKIAARLEGSRKEYITGGGQKQCVNRRVEIYEKEGDVHAERRTDRRNNNSNNNNDEHAPAPAPAAAGTNPKKRTQPQSVIRQTKLIRLPSDDVYRLTRNPNDPVPVSLSSTGLQSSRSTVGSSSSNSFVAPPPQTAWAVPTQVLPPLGGPLPPISSSVLGIPNPPALETSQSDFSLGLGEQVDFNEWFKFDIPDPVENVNDDMPPPQFLPTYSNNSNNVGNTGLNSMIYPNNYSNTIGVQLSDTFPPTLSRATSEALNRLLPGGEVWNMIDSDAPQNVSEDVENRQEMLTHPASAPIEPSNVGPLQLMRSISWDVYNGTFSEDLKSILDSF